MFEPISELSPDLDWMLQSGQASREMIAEVLVREYYSPVYRLALSILSDSEAAFSATLETFSAVLMDNYLYRGQIGAQAWLYGIALHTCRREGEKLQIKQTLQAALSMFSDLSEPGDRIPEGTFDANLWMAVDALSETERLILLFRYVYGWGHQEIGAVLRMSADDVAIKLRSTRYSLLMSIWSAENGVLLTDQDLELNQLDTNLTRSLKMHWPAPEISGDELDELIDRVLDKAVKGTTQKRGLTAIRELALVVVAVLGAVGSIWGVNTFWPEPDPTPFVLPTIVETKLVYVKPPLTTPSSPMPTVPGPPTPIPEGVFYTAKPGDTLPDIADQLGISIGTLREMNRIPPDAPLLEGQRLVIPYRLSPGVYPTATPVTPLPQAEPSGQPNNFVLGLSASTIWFDARVIIYGSPGYIGPPLVHRIQVWVSTDQALVLTGSLNSVAEVWLLNEDNLYMAEPGNGQPWFFEWPDESTFAGMVAEDFGMIFSTSIDNGSGVKMGTLRNAGREAVAGRQAIVFDQLDADNERISRLWTDEQTGLILRRQLFQRESLPEISREIVVTGVAYDVDFPQELFDPRLPWRGGYAQDHTGKPIQVETVSREWLPPLAEAPVQLLPLSSDVDLSQSELSFQYLDGFDAAAPTAIVDLYADQNYYLGRAVFGNPWSMICGRSPDGERIAYVSQPSQFSTENPILHWFSLKELSAGLLGEVHSLDDIAVTQFAFAPDSRHLAVFGYVEQFKDGALYFLDTETGEIRHVLDLADARSLVWSPDGEYLALLARYTATSYEDHIVVVKVSTATAIYSGSIDFEKNASLDWPTSSWGVEFPVDIGGLEACSSPPG